MMRTQLENDGKEDYYDDPIRLFDFELQRVYGGSRSIKFVTGQPTLTADKVFEYENIRLYGNHIEDKDSSNSEENGNQGCVIDIDDSSDSDRTVIVEIDEEKNKADIDDCFIIDTKVNIVAGAQGDPKNAHEDLLIKKALSQKNKTQLDFKLNKGLIGMTVTPKFILNEMLDVDVNKTDKIVYDQINNNKRTGEINVTSCKETCSLVGTNRAAYSEYINIGKFEDQTEQEQQLNREKQVNNRSNKYSHRNDYLKSSDLKISASTNYKHIKSSKLSSKSRERLNHVENSMKRRKKWNMNELFNNSVTVISKKPTNKVIDKSFKPDNNLEQIIHNVIENKLHIPLCDCTYSTSKEGANRISTGYAPISRDNRSSVQANYNMKKIRNNLCDDNKRSASANVRKNIAHNSLDGYVNTSVETVQVTEHPNLYNDSQCIIHKSTISTPVSFCDGIKSNNSSIIQTLEDDMTHSELNIDYNINNTTTRNPVTATTAIILRPDHQQKYPNKYSINQFTDNTEISLKKVNVCQPITLKKPFISKDPELYKSRMAISDNQFTPPQFKYKCYLRDKSSIKLRPIDIELLKTNNSCTPIMTQEPSAETLTDWQLHSSKIDGKLKISASNRTLEANKVQFNKESEAERDDNNIRSLQKSSRVIADEVRSGITKGNNTSTNTIKDAEVDIIPSNLKKRSLEIYSEETNIIQTPITEIKKLKSNLHDKISQIWANCAYSPPILPIPTYGKTLDSVNFEFDSMSGIKNRIVTKHVEGIDIKQGKSNQGGLKKITLDEYKNRVNNLGISDIES